METLRLSDATLQIDIRLSDEGLGTADDDRAVQELTDQLQASLREGGCAFSGWEATGGGWTVLTYSGPDAWELFERAKPILDGWARGPFYPVLYFADEIGAEGLKWADDGTLLRQYLVMIHVRLSDDDLGTEEDDNLLYHLSDRLFELLESAEIATYDGHCFGGGWFEAFCYTREREGLWEQIRPLLAELGGRELYCTVHAVE